MQKLLALSLCLIAMFSLAGVISNGASGEQPAATMPQAAESKPKGWLLDAPSDTERFKLLQMQAGGFSAAMMEVAYRYEALYDALGDENFELAVYHWEKIKEAIVLGYTRRPKRQKNADQVFIDAVYEPVLADLKSGNADNAWTAFAKARKACMQCHDDEKVEFMNKQRLFRDTQKPKGR